MKQSQMGRTVRHDLAGSIAHSRARDSSLLNATADSAVSRWFKVNSLVEWYQTPAQLELLEADPAQYFAATRGLVAGKGPDGTVYLLLWTTPDRCMTHEPGSKEWAM